MLIVSGIIKPAFLEYWQWPAKGNTRERDSSADYIYCWWQL